MIKANELRIGNWLKDFGDGYGKVTGIYSGNPAYDEDSDVLTTANPVPQPDSSFTPIPLTPEILEKCGFEWDIYWQGITDGRYVLKENWISSNEMKGYTITYGKDHRTVSFMMPIESLHQFQNLYFALTGEELTINL